MSDPTQLLTHVNDLCVELNLNRMRTGQIPGVDSNLFKPLYRESKIKLPSGALHNPVINYCEESDTTIVPSRFYEFKHITKDVVCNMDPHEEIPPECAVYINGTAAPVSRSLMSACRTISHQSPITDLYVNSLRYHDVTEPDVFNMSHHLVSLTLEDSTLPSPVMSDLLHQVSECSTIHRINLRNAYLGDITYVTLSNKTSLTHLTLHKTEMSAELCESVCKQLKHLVHLEHLTLSENPNLGAYSDYITEAFEAWGCDSPLRKLDLSICGDVVSRPHLSAISRNCKQLNDLDLVHNTLTGMLSGFTPSLSLEVLKLGEAALNKEDLYHLTCLVRSNKLPRLEELWVWESKMCDMEDELADLIEACVTHHQRELRLLLQDKNLSEEFKEKWTRCCEGTCIKLDLRSLW